MMGHERTRKLAPSSSIMTTLPIDLYCMICDRYYREVLLSDNGPHRSAWCLRCHIWLGHLQKSRSDLAKRDRQIFDSTHPHAFIVTATKRMGLGLLTIPIGVTDREGEGNYRTWQIAKDPAVTIRYEFTELGTSKEH